MGEEKRLDHHRLPNNPKLRRGWVWGKNWTEFSLSFLWCHCVRGLSLLSAAKEAPGRGCPWPGMCWSQGAIQRARYSVWYCLCSSWAFFVLQSCHLPASSTTTCSSASQYLKFPTWRTEVHLSLNYSLLQLALVFLNLWCPYCLSCRQHHSGLTILLCEHCFR